MSHIDEFNAIDVNAPILRDEFNVNAAEYSSKPASKKKEKSAIEKRRADLTKAFLATVVVAGAATGVIPLIPESPSEPVSLSILPNEITLEFDQSKLDEDPNLPFSLPGFHDEEGRYKDFVLSLNQFSQLYGEQKQEISFDPSTSELPSIPCESFLYDQRAPLTYTLSATYNEESTTILSDSLILFPDALHILPQHIRFENSLVSSEAETHIEIYSLNFFDNDNAYSSFYYEANEMDVSGEIRRQLGEKTSAKLEPFTVDITNLIDYAYIITFTIRAYYLEEEITLLNDDTSSLNISNIYDFDVIYGESNAKENYFTATFEFYDPDDEIVSIEGDFYQNDDIFLETKSWTKEDIIMHQYTISFSVNGYQVGERLSAQYFAVTKSGELKELTWSNIVS